MLPYTLVAGALFFAWTLSGADLAGEAVAVLEKRCHQCHNSKTQMAGVKLTSTSEVTAVRDKLLAAVSYSGKIKMPPTGALAAGEVQALTAWLAAGAAWPKEARAAGSGAPVWWAFRKPERPRMAQTGSAAIDAFIGAKLSERGLTASQEADRAALIRRATFDLHGLPPTREEIAEFAGDTRSDAYAQLIERLLASPRYGERWAGHWLDLVRYGDTSGFEQDPYLLYAWRYRDYVVKSFNSDKPYDRFVKEQIAGDELYPDDPESAQGTGYFTVGTNRDMLYKVEDINRVETLTDYVDTTASVFLGLTVGCARCHDHKFDPITQRDYYRLQAVFQPFVKSRVFLHYNNARGYDLGENTRNFRLYEIGAQLMALLDPYRTKLREERLAKLAPEVGAAFHTPDDQKTPEMKALADAHAKKVEPTDDEVYALLSPAETERLHKIERRLVAMYKTYQPGPFAPALTDLSREAPKTFLPVKGKPDGEEVGPGFPSALGGGDIPEAPMTATTSHRRKAFAEWIASPDNPLTARVMVNRIWQYHFGRGIVSTPSDFGTRAPAASHPELLEWLTTEFVARKWSIKEMHRLILNSATYKQSARPAPKALEADPDNLLLSHFTRRRLEAEEVRDAMLRSSGVLNLKMGGRPVVPPLEAEELYGMSQPLANAWIVNEDPAEQRRRSLYMISRRNFRIPLLETFDRPEGVLSCSRRESSTTAPQSLSLLNGRFTLDRAKELAARVETEPDPVRAAWRAVYGREPQAFESERARAFLDKQSAHLGSRGAALVELARGLFNTNEFLYVE